MRLINKKSPPGSFVTYIKSSHVSYNGIDKKERQDLLKALLKEQSGVCAYCQQKIKLVNATIEHHCEQSICNGQDGKPDLRLDYKNMFAVCLGVGGSKKETHCDTKKSEMARKNAAANGLPMKINPTNSAHIKTIKYSSTGIISSESTALYDVEMNKLLNLNAKHLKDKRSKKWRRLFNAAQGKNGFNPKKLERVLQEDLAKKGGMFSKDLPGMSEFMLKYTK